MSRTYLPPKCGYRIDGKRIVTDGTVKNKVSGTSMAGILGLSPFTTPFQVACSLLGLAREDISNKPAVKVGVALEDRIIRYAGKAYPQYGTFCSADEVYQKRENDHDSWVSDFEDDYFAGHVDGIVFDDNGDDHILEIKTSSNLDSWADGVPVYYYWQVALYNHFISKKDKAYVVLGMVNDATYRDMSSWVPNEDTVAFFEMPIDTEEVDRTLGLVREWYQNFVEKGETPEYDPNNPGDVEMFTHLCTVAADEDDIQAAIDEYGRLDEEILAHEAEMGAKYERRAQLKTELKEYFETSTLSQMDSISGKYYVKIGSTSRTSWDEARMIADGIDVTKYKTKTVSKTFSIKRSQE